MDYGTMRERGWSHASAGAGAIAPLGHMHTPEAAVSSLRDPEKPHMGRLVGGHVDRPGQRLLMLLGGHGVASCRELRQQKRPLTLRVQHARALRVRDDDVDIGRKLRRRCVGDGEFEIQRILPGGCFERLRFLRPDTTTDVGHAALSLLWRQRARQGSERQRGYEQADDDDPGCDKR